MQIHQWTVGPLAENTYLLVCPDTRQAIFVDPGDEADLLWQGLEAAGAELQAIVLTHAHLDHVGAVEAIRRRASVPVYLHPADNDLLAEAPDWGRRFGLVIAPVAPADHPLSHGDHLAWGTIALDVLHTPGHTAGGVCFYAPGDSTILAGDTLFHRGIGRTDMPGGDARTLIHSIETQLWPLPDNVRVLPGHGPATTIGEERRLNPFVGSAASRGLPRERSDVFGKDTA